MAPYLVQFVDSISATPTVRLDVNASPWSVRRQETQLPPPPLRRAVVSSLLQDGERIPAAAYGNRVITLRLGLDETITDDAAAGYIQTLTRELDRASNLLKWQPGTSNPVFFKTLRADYDALVWDPVQKVATVSLPAEPFAYGLKEVLPTAVVSNDPLQADPLTINTNPYFETDASGWTGINGATIARTTSVAHQGVGALSITPNGSTGNPSARSVPQSVTVGTTYYGHIWARSAGGYASGVAAVIDWCDGGGTTTTSVIPSPTSLSAGVWTALPVSGVAPGGTVQGAIRLRYNGTPLATDVVVMDEAILYTGADGTAKTNAAWCDFAGIKGDVETPLVMGIDSTTGANSTTSAFAVRRRGTPSATPFALEAERMTAGTDTALASVQDTTFSGFGQNYQRTTFSTDATWQTRLSMTTYPASPSADARGTYRVYARCRLSAGSSSVTLRMAWGVSFSPITGDEVSITHTTLKLVDLGQLSIPVGMDPVCDGPGGPDLSTYGITVYLQAKRNSGAASLDVDYLVFMPADDRQCVVTWPVNTGGTAADQFVVDAMHDMVYPIAANGYVLGSTGGSFIGGLPMVSPGVTNRLFVLRSVSLNPFADNLGTNTTINAWYWPRYVFVRGAS